MLEQFDYEVLIVGYEPIPVRAWTTLVPGLCVHEAIRNPLFTIQPPDDMHWAVTHRRSTSMLCFAPDPETAQMLAVRIARDTGFDFTLSVAELEPAITAWKADGHDMTEYGPNTGVAVSQVPTAMHR